MPLQIPQLDDRTFEQLLEEARTRIPAYTPEWTNFDLDSDPGITLIQVFAFLTDALLYRANRIPERDRLKFLQLLGIPLQPAGAAQGVITISNQRGPLQALPLAPGVVVQAGAAGFLTQDGVTVLPMEARAYYKSPIGTNDPNYADYQRKYAAVLAAAQALDSSASAGLATNTSGPAVSLSFYQGKSMLLPTAGNPNPSLDLVTETIDNALYLALLAPQNVSPDDVRGAIADKVLSIGIVPALTGNVAPLIPARRDPSTAPTTNPSLVYEIADASGDTSAARYAALKLIQQPDVLNTTGIVQVQLPGVAGLQTWDYTEPMQEGTGDFPPPLSDTQLAARLITWIRLRLPTAPTAAASSATGTTATGSSGTTAAPGSGVSGSNAPSSVTVSAQNGTASAQLSWVGINAARVQQAIPVPNELLGVAMGEPDQVAQLANTPVITGTIQVGVEDITGMLQLWRLTDDLLTAGPNDPVFTLDPDAGQITFGDGLRGLRPPFGRRIRASYQYGGGVQGNVAIGAISASPDLRLQGGFTIANPLPTSGGKAGDTEAEGERKIPLYLRHRDRLVTALDFQDITLNTTGVTVGRAETLPLFHPDQPQTLAPGVVTVMVIPQFDAVQPYWPSPDRLFLQAVCDYLDPRRLITTEIYVRGPVYVKVYLSVGVQVQDGFFRDVVLQSVTQRLNVYLSALQPGGPDGNGWPLNKPILEKDLEAVVTRVSGVEFVNSLDLSVENNQANLSGLQLPLLAGLSVVEGAAAALTGSTGPAGRAVPVPVTKANC